MTLIAWADCETTGLLYEKREKDGTMHPPMDRVHCLAAIIWDTVADTIEKWSAADQPGYIMGRQGRGWQRCSIVDLLRKLEECDLLIGQNWQDFDDRALRLIYPWWRNPKKLPWWYAREEGMVDTLILSRLIYPDIAKAGPNAHKLYGWEKGQHSLKSWGKRLGEHKGDYSGGWMHWSEEMQSYMEQDVEVLVKQWRWLNAQKPAPQAVALEHAFAAILRRQEHWGVGFDHPKALVLLGKLTERERILEAQLIEDFGEWWDYGLKADNQSEAHTKEVYKDYDEDDDEEDEEEQARRAALFYANTQYAEVRIPTKSRRVKMLGFPDVTRPRVSPTTGRPLKDYVGPPLIEYTQGHPYTPIKRVQFNPSSRTQIYKRLMAKYDWKPLKFTPVSKQFPGGQPKVDEEVLKGLPYPEAERLAEYMLVLKRLGQLAVGQKAWLKVAKETVQPNGTSLYRIHGRVNTNGAVTGRCTHSDPNLAQIPKNTSGTKEYPDTPELHGFACRDLFVPSPGFELVGFDGAALELRMLAHFIFPWDKGEYADIVDKGNKDLGTDPHSWLRDLIGTDIIGTGGAGRDNAKTAMYATLYGAGKLKMGSIVIPKGTDREKMQVGGEIQAKMAERFVAKAQLQQAIESAVESRGYLVGLDGRHLRIRKAHAALNTLLQSAGAVVMKQALVSLDRSLQTQASMVPGVEYAFVLNIHDEAQAEVVPNRVPLYMELAEASLPEAGKIFRLNCPLKAEASSGSSWASTH